MLRQNLVGLCPGGLLRKKDEIIVNIFHFQCSKKAWKLAEDVKKVEKVSSGMQRFLKHPNNTYT